MESVHLLRATFSGERAALGDVPLQRAVLRAAAGESLRLVHGGAIVAGGTVHLRFFARPAGQPRRRAAGGDDLRVERLLPQPRGLHHDSGGGGLAAAGAGGHRAGHPQAGREGDGGLVAHSLSGGGERGDGYAGAGGAHRNYLLRAAGQRAVRPVATGRAVAGAKDPSPCPATGGLAAGDDAGGVGAGGGAVHPLSGDWHGQFPRGGGLAGAGARLGASGAAHYQFCHPQLLRQSGAPRLLRCGQPDVATAGAERARRREPPLPALHRLGHQNRRRSGGVHRHPAADAGGAGGHFRHSSSVKRQTSIVNRQSSIVNRQPSTVKRQAHHPRPLFRPPRPPLPAVRLRHAVVRGVVLRIAGLESTPFAVPVDLPLHPERGGAGGVGRDVAGAVRQRPPKRDTPRRRAAPPGADFAAAGLAALLGRAGGRAGDAGGAGRARAVHRAGAGGG